MNIKNRIEKLEKRTPKTRGCPIWIEETHGKFIEAIWRAQWPNSALPLVVVD